MDSGRIALVVVILIGLSACSDGGDCYRPIHEFIPPEVPESEGGAGTGGGACAAWVDFADDDGFWWRDMRSDGWRFHIDDGELTQYSEATEATFLVHPVSEETVWSVRGLDPRAFVVMRSAEDGELFFLVPEGADRVEVDAVLCRYATGMDFTVREHCPAGR